MPTLSEKIVLSVGTGKDPAEITVLDTLDALTATATELNTMAGITATTAELNGIADLSVRTVIVPAGGAATVLPAGGATVLIPLVTANVTATLPVAVAGLTYEFIYIGSAADAEDWVISCPAATLFAGGVQHLVSGTPDIDVAQANGSTHNTLTVNNPLAGTAVRFIGVATGTWAVTGFTVGATISAFSAV
jgi:hypothetical protein